MPVYLVYAAAFFAYALMEWYRWFVRAPYYPVLFSLVALVVVSYSVYRLWALRQRARDLELGRDGERTVGEILDQLKTKGCAVIHDVVATDFNVDHVVVAPQGIYTIETKTFSKPPGAEIAFSGDGLVAAGFNIGGDAIVQAEAEAKWIRSLLAESTGRRFPVKPVVLFVSWFVQPMPRPIKERAWVLNPKALPSFIANEPAVLAPSDMHLIAFHLAAYVRMRNAQAA
jgi:hypothetical protein